MDHISQGSDLDPYTPLLGLADTRDAVLGVRQHELAPLQDDHEGLPRSHDVTACNRQECGGNPSEDRQR